MFYEKNKCEKNPLRVDIRFASVYPNVYKTAMSSLGYQIIYSLVNEREDSYCERVVYPSHRSLETNSPLRDFDIISFTIQYEQDYFNVLEILNKAEIPLRREDRAADDPLIIAGGPCATANPLPLSDFIDIFVIGEAEAVLNDFLDIYLDLKDNGRLSRNDLSPFLDIKSLYISEFNNNAEIAVLDEMDNAYQLTRPIITQTDDDDLLPVFSNSIFLNVSRACTRGCRFCMSSYLYRPQREADVDLLLDTALKTRENTGISKINLIGAAVSDYSNIDCLLEALRGNDFEVSTPSMRIESITREILISLRQGGLKTLTIAPESIESIRKKINKDIPDEKIFEVVRDAVDLGFNIKLYFIIGISSSSDEDIVELKDFIKKIDSMKYNIDSNSKSSSRKAKVSIKFSVNPLIPKPHTPMQWNAYDMKDIKSKIRYLKKNLKGVDIKFDSAKMGLIQYVLSCGGRDVGELLEKSLSRKISMKEWKENAPNYNLDDDLPWDVIDVSVSKEFLISEREKMESREQTPWCEEFGCYDCGACQ